MGISRGARGVARRLLLFMGLGGALARYRAWRLDRSEIVEVTPLAGPAATGHKPALGAHLLACDARTALHLPGRTSLTYGSDTSETVEYRFNSAGYRSEELDPKARLRVLLVGESHALGNGVPFEQTLGQRFKTHLALALTLPEEAINVINLSAGGTSADYCARTLIRQVDIAAPDLVLCLFPEPDRIEDYSANRVKSYKVAGIDPEQLETAPIPVQGFIDLYNVHFGRMNMARNALLIQSMCRLRGIENIIVSDELRPRHFRTPVLQPIYAQLDRGRLLLHSFFANRADLAADGMHAGVRTHEAVAIMMLARYAALLKAGGQAERGGRLSDYVRRLKKDSEDWKFVRQAKRQ